MYLFIFLFIHHLIFICLPLYLFFACWVVGSNGLNLKEYIVQVKKKLYSSIHLIFFGKYLSFLSNLKADWKWYLCKPVGSKLKLDLSSWEYHVYEIGAVGVRFEGNEKHWILGVAWTFDVLNCFHETYIWYICIYLNLFHFLIPLLWHNGCGSVSNHQRHDYLLNRLFRRRSKKTSKLRVTGLCVTGPVNFPHKWPVTRKMFPFDEVIMLRWHR